MEFCIGVQFVNRRLTMTGMWRVEPNIFLKIIQNLKFSQIKNYLTPLGVSLFKKL